MYVQNQKKKKRKGEREVRQRWMDFIEKLV